MKPLVTDSAMVMAAGLGTRMRPLTETLPKPLVRVAGKPLIDHALDRLAEAGIARAVVNVHHFPEAVEAHLRERRTPRVTISDERDLLLETGGGMVRAQGLLPDPFFCVNSDNIWLDGPKDAFRELSDAWDPARMDALLLLVAHTGARNFAGKGDFHMDGRGRLARRLDRQAPSAARDRPVRPRLKRGRLGGALTRAAAPRRRGRRPAPPRPSPPRSR